MKWLAAAAAGAVLMAGPAFAQEKRVIQEKDRIIYKKKTSVDFEAMAVDGDLTRPEGSYVLNRKKAAFQNLIKVRSNFAPELQKSLDHL